MNNLGVKKITEYFSNFILKISKPQNIIKIIYFTISVGLARGVYTILLLIIDYRFDDVITGNSASKIAIISLLSFIFQYGGVLSVFREGVNDFKKAKQLLNTHILIGLISVLSIYFLGLIDKFSFSIILLSFFFDLFESYYRSKSQDFKMMLISFTKFNLILGAFLIFDFNFASVFLFWISLSIITLNIFLNGFSIRNYTKIEFYSWHTLLIGLFAWLINSSDKFISLYFISPENLRDYSVTYALGAPLLLTGGIFNLILSRDYFKGLKHSNQY